MLHRVKHHVGNFLPALRSRNYRLYFIGQGISLVGTWMATVAEQWLVYPTLTSNKSLLGVVSAVNLAPMAFFVLLAGVIADRIDRRRGVIIQHLLYAAIAMVMGTLVLTGVVRVWHVMVSAFLMGVIFAFDMPTRQALMMSAVQKRDYGSAIALNSGIFNVARAIGPAIGGVLIAIAGIAPAYFFNSISFLAVILCVWLMRSFPSRQYPQGTIKQDFFAGIGYVVAHKDTLLLLSLLAVLTVTTWPAATLLPVFAHDIYRRGAVGFGLMQAAFGVGAGGGALLFSVIQRAVVDKRILLVGNIAGLFISYSLFALSPWFVFAMVMMVIQGFAVVTIITTVNTLIQTRVPDALRGRVLSFYSFVLVGSMPAGAMLSSLGVATIGARMTVLVGAVAFGILCASMLAVWKDLFRLATRGG